MTSRGAGRKHQPLACLLLMLLAGAGLAQPLGMLQFMKARDQRAWHPTPRRVLAFYYTWYGPVEQNGSARHWGRLNAAARDIETARDYPVGGAYDSMDPALIDRFDTQALPELPPTASFPANGDRRWRPATVAMTAEGDEHEALATLRDRQGRSYGEGMCLMRHVHSEPRGATVLYVWMRMADVVGRDELMTAIFRLAAGRC